MAKTNIFDLANPQPAQNGPNAFADFLLTKGLYDSMEINEDNISDLISLLNGTVRISSYCKECKEERVFTMNPIEYLAENMGEYYKEKLSDKVASLQKSEFSIDYRIANGTPWGWKSWWIEDQTRLLNFEFCCTMDPTHHLDFVVLTDDSNFKKIGQYPSVADMSFPELDQYKNVLSPLDRKEFGSAIGLYAHGVGAGSYVYLRRILERLLFQAKANAGDVINSDEFSSARVGKKITMLKEYLPDMLTSNATIYGILSKGIHELTEKECRAYFPVVKDCLFMILQEWEEMKKKQENKKSISAALAKIASSIK